MGSIGVYEDQALGPWLCCPDCGFAGTLVDLVMAVRALPALEACHLLASAGAMPAVTKEELQQLFRGGLIGARRAYLRAWQQVRGRPPRRRSRQLGFLTPALWASPLGQMLGASDLPTFLETAELPHAANTQRRCYGASGHVEAVLVPHFDAPERVVAFNVLGPKTALASYSAEAGLGFLGSLQKSHPALTTYIVGINDPVAALHLQTRHLGTAGRQLPLVTWYDTPLKYTSAAAWRACDGRSVVILESERTLAGLCQAILSDGCYCCLSIPQMLRSNKPSYDILREVTATAHTWRTELQRWLRRSNPSAVMELQTLLEQRGVCAFDVGEPLRYRQRDRWRFLSKVRERRRQSTHVDGIGTVIETQRGWFYHHGNRLRPITALRFRVDKIYDNFNGELLCDGRFYRYRESFPFLGIKVADLQARADIVLRELLANIGASRAAAESEARRMQWRPYLWAIALKFHKPQGAGLLNQCRPSSLCAVDAKSGPAPQD